jgi:L-ascorbate metabolism protein UlaG (beta-lactamase superfamily)
MWPQLLRVVGALFVALVTAGLVVGWGLSAPGHVGPKTDNFDGTQFSNAQSTPLPAFRDALRMMWSADPGPWDDWREVIPAAPPPERVHGTDLRATFVNHATILLQMDGMNVLTDPIWSQRTSAVQFLGPERHHAPGVRFEDLPPIDLVLISHSHYDHLDVDTLRRLEAAHQPLVVAGLGNGLYLRSLGLARVEELDWGDTLEVGPLMLTAERTRHFSGRGLFDRQKTLWIGVSIDGASGGVYFGGDTGYGDHFAQTGRRHGPYRLALLPIGAYAPRWFMGPIHMDPVDAVRAHQDLGAAQSVGIHFGTFQLTEEAQDAPVAELRDALQAAGVPLPAFRALRPGEAWMIP